MPFVGSTSDLYSKLVIGTTHAILSHNSQCYKERFGCTSMVLHNIMVLLDSCRSFALNHRYTIQHTKHAHGSRLSVSFVVAWYRPIYPYFHGFFTGDWSNFMSAMVAVKQPWIMRIINWVHCCYNLIRIKQLNHVHVLWHALYTVRYKCNVGSVWFILAYGWPERMAIFSCIDVHIPVMNINPFHVGSL